ncbi:thiamine pyrophosphokinase [Ruminococcaceae bacterium YRB3002]|nr:thiamine pyrophosphokinase [Ruminococcaceae bacterium YRB3002]
MCIAVVTGGPIPDAAAVIASGAETLYCADSGLDHLISWGLKPDLFVGDMDSVSDEGRAFLERYDIPRKLYSSDKDMTDTDLVLSLCPPGSEVILICSLTGRIDHVVTNLDLLIRYKEAGVEITATDGVTDVIPVIGGNGDPGSVRLSGIEHPEELAVSILPFACDMAEGVTTKGLHYELDNATLLAASSYSVSNYPEDGIDLIEVGVLRGRLLVTLTKRV